MDDVSLGVQANISPGSPTAQEDLTIGPGLVHSIDSTSDGRPSGSQNLISTGSNSKRPDPQSVLSRGIELPRATAQDTLQASTPAQNNFVPGGGGVEEQDTEPFSKSSVSQNEGEFASPSIYIYLYKLTIIQIEAIRGSGLCPDLHFMNTTSRSSETYPLKTDISVFTHASNPGTASKQSATLDWGPVELWAENKPKKTVLFIKIEELRNNALVVSAQVGWTTKAYRTCGQLIAYATALHLSQFRAFSFSIAIFGDAGHLLRWDRSGVIIPHH